MSTDLTKLKKEELQEMAEDAGLRFTPENTKAELIAMIEAAEEADGGSQGEEAESDVSEATEAATTTDEQEELQRRLTEARATKVRTKGVLVIEWLGRVVAPDWYFGAKLPAKATSIVMVDENENERLHSFYRIPDTEQTRAMFSNNKLVRILKTEEFTDEIKIKLAMADEQKRRSAAKHRRLMQAEGLR